MINALPTPRPVKVWVISPFHDRPLEVDGREYEVLSMDSEAEVSPEIGTYRPGTVQMFCYSVESFPLWHL